MYLLLQQRLFPTLRKLQTAVLRTLQSKVGNRGYWKTRHQVDPLLPSDHELGAASERSILMDFIDSDPIDSDDYMCEIKAVCANCKSQPPTEI